jgi:cellulose-binding protein
MKVMNDINITNLKVPSVTKPKKIHFFVAVTDDGNPKLTRYERVIITITP